MTDDVKAAWERVRDRHWTWCHEIPCPQCDDFETVDAHLDGEPARTAAAVADASSAALRAMERAVKAEAERDALRRELADLIPLAESAMRQANNDGGEYDIKAELADARRVAEANMQTAERASQSIDAVAAERDALDKLRHDYKCALEKSDADLMTVRCERDALRAQVTKLEADQHCPTCGSSVYTCVDCDVAPLRAQVLDAKALAMSLRCSADCARETCSDEGCIIARGFLAAMDGARP